MTNETSTTRAITEQAMKNPALAHGAKDPDAAQAKKLLAEIEGLVLELAQARVDFARHFGESRDLQQIVAAPRPAEQVVRTPLGRSFFPDAFRLIGDARRDVKVIGAQVQQLVAKA